MLIEDWSAFWFEDSCSRLKLDPLYSSGYGLTSPSTFYRLCCFIDFCALSGVLVSIDLISTELGLPFDAEFLFFEPLGLPLFLFGAPLFIENACIAVSVGMPMGRAPVPERFSLQSSLDLRSAC